MSGESDLNTTLSSDGMSNPTESPMKPSAAHGGIAGQSKRKRRQDWCRWPLCPEYQHSGQCRFYDPSMDESIAQICEAAHISPADQSKIGVSPDGYVRVCFDSMGLVQPACQRFGCTFYHPPKYIRDLIVAKRHAQYLREKVAKLHQQKFPVNLPSYFQRNAANSFGDKAFGVEDPIQLAYPNIDESCLKQPFVPNQGSALGLNPYFAMPQSLPGYDASSGAMSLDAQQQQMYQANMKLLMSGGGQQPLLNYSGNDLMQKTQPHPSLNNGFFPPVNPQQPLYNQLIDQSRMLYWPIDMNYMTLVANQMSALPPIPRQTITTSAHQLAPTTSGVGLYSGLIPTTVSHPLMLPLVTAAGQPSGLISASGLSNKSPVPSVYIGPATASLPVALENTITASGSIAAAGTTVPAKPSMQPQQPH